MAKKQTKQKPQKILFTGEFKLLPVKKLEVDLAYQRDLKKKAVIYRIKTRFSWSKFGAISVSRRKDGSYYILDGQHRANAATLIEGLYEIPCLVFVGLSVEQEAETFVGINTDRTAMGAIDRYKARLIYGEPLAMQMHEILENNGWTVARAEVPMVLKAISSFERVFCAFGPDTAENVVMFCAEYFDGIMQNALLKALGLTDYYLRVERSESILDYSNQLGCLEECQRAIRNAKAKTNSSDVITMSRGIMDLINKRKHHKIRLRYTAPRCVKGVAPKYASRDLPHPESF